MDFDLLKSRFVGRVMADAGAEMEKDINRVISSNAFSDPKWSKRNIATSDTGLVYSHLADHRFVNMKRNTINGKSVKRRSYPIHNQIVMSHYNNIISELKYGFTTAVKEELMNIKDN
ncbi:hypothetical protein [Myroides odoratimimus]|uniref:hypothetical protein n=1 Tax=Myroides odoratimimus TaxID=76832 RepID=UPI0025765D9A|nr:hypothetical protein [Myroides odoratimimus]MDM1529001.1 hypothetical protein [Myroides odoratimimus]MDM1537224.1 hypothetical protein [Myroides odoratimimus]MDM1676727.1 hypothetical protein [Myroides odoratimimus]